jgi:hypothetical protein
VPNVTFECVLLVFIAISTHTPGTDDSQIDGLGKPGLDLIGGL